MRDSSTPGIKTVPHPAGEPATTIELYLARLGVHARSDDRHSLGSECAVQQLNLEPGEGPQVTTPQVAPWRLSAPGGKLAEGVGAGASETKPRHCPSPLRPWLRLPALPC